jgi:hypothetical protein
VLQGPLFKTFSSKLPTLLATLLTQHSAPVCVDRPPMSGGLIAARASAAVTRLVPFKDIHVWPAGPPVAIWTAALFTARTGRAVKLALL